MPASREVKFTHLDRIVFPQAKLTKGDVLEYYAKVADKLLPHLRDRPITVERYPEGVADKAPHFWQKNAPAYYPKWIPRFAERDEDGEITQYPIINDLPSLLYIVNQNAITFHTWFSRTKSPDRPDFVLFDIDPHQSTFANAVKVAKVLHAMLDQEGIENFIKTSGKSGLHVMTPWKKRAGFDAVKAWALPIARRVAAKLPSIATTERMIAKRGSRVYIDVMQNASGKHAVPAYVLRATPTATVAMPLKWSEVNAKLSPARFDMKSAIKRINAWKRDPLAALV